MSLLTALTKLSTQFNSTSVISGLPAVTLGAPNNWKDAPYPKFFLDVTAIRPRYEALQAAFETSEEADAFFVFVVGQGNLPVGQTWFEWKLTLAKAIQDKLVADTIARVYESDGGDGFRVEVVSMQFEYDPEVPIVTGMVRIKISQYQN